MKIEKKYIGVSEFTKGVVFTDFSVASLSSCNLSFDAIEKNKDGSIVLSIDCRSDFNVLKYLKDSKFSSDDWKQFDSVYTVTLSKKQILQIINELEKK